MSDEFELVEHDRARIKGLLRAGAFTPGRVINLEALAERLDSSLEIVGYALAQLTGERLVDITNDRVRTFPAAPNDIVQLYQWQMEVVGMALNMERTPVPFGFPANDGSVASRTEELFLEIAAATGNSVVMEVMAQSVERLYFARRLEPGVVEPDHGELASLRNAWVCGDIAAAKTKLKQHLQRRQACAAELSLKWCATGDPALTHEPLRVVLP